MGRVAFKDLWAPKDIWLDTGFSGRDGEFLTEITKLILWIEDIYGTKNEFLCHGCNFNIHSNFSYTQWVQENFDPSVKHMFQRSSHYFCGLEYDSVFFKENSESAVEDAIVNLIKVLNCDKCRDRNSR